MGDGIIPGSIAHALDLFDHTQWQTSWGRFHRQLARSTLDAQRNTAVTAVFPLPLSYLDAEFEVRGGDAFPSRLEQPGALKSLGTARLVNVLCSLLSFFEAGRPRSQGSFQLGHRELNSRFICSSSGGDIQSMGRGRARLAVALANAAQATSVYSSAAGKKDSFRVQVAEDVDLARVGFLKEAGRLQGEKFMAPERAKVFHDLAQIMLPSEQVPKIGIRSCHRVRPEDEQQFLEALLRSGKGVLVEEDLLPRHPHRGHLLKGGCFAVAHTRGRQRHIYDRRSINETERDLSDEWLLLPHGTQWFDFVLQPQDFVCGATADLSN